MHRSLRMLAACVAFGLIVAASPAAQAQTLTTLHSFCAQIACPNGWLAYAGPMQASDGNFYGTTFIGGANDEGTVVKLTAIPVAALSPTSLTFSGQEVDTESAVKTVTLSNTGTLSLAVSSIAITGTDEADFSQTHTCGSSLAPGSHCTIDVTFTPKATGALSATLTITDNNKGVADSKQTLSLTGTGTAPVAGVSVASHGFGSENVGVTTAAFAVTLSNTGTAALAITSLGTSANFGETNTCGSSVAAGAHCTIDVTFKPTTTGALSGKLTITDNSHGVKGSEQTVNLTGTGLAAIAVTLTPGSKTLAEGDSQVFTATIDNALNSELAWYVNGVLKGDSAQGTLTACTTVAPFTCTYTAPASAVPSPNPAVIKVESVEDPAKDATAEVTVSIQSSVTVEQSSKGAAITDQLMGMNMAAWYDPTDPAIVPAFQTAGIKAVRWPGGSWSDDYHWATNTLCNGTPNGDATFSNFVSKLAIPAGLDVALTADYGTNAACTGPGDPTEAAAWVSAALTDGITVSHMTVGNEEYGSWETDYHSNPHDAATYAAATAGSSGYYSLIKAASPKTLVGVSVDPNSGYPDWDPVVLANAKGYYDFVEYHFYPQAPGEESDVFLTQQAAQELTTAINEIKQELATAGEPDKPIYVGEIGSVYNDPGKQTTSITQALFAGQVLGEMMNDGVSRATWWLGFGGCSDATSGNFSSSLYGWQTFGGYMVFSDGLPEYGCEDAPSLAAGVLLPTARAFQLFSQVAISGENVLTADVTGDRTNVRAYAATNKGGTALVLFNLNETTSAPVTVTLSGQSSSTEVTVKTYSKSIYDESKNGVWAPPTTTSLGAQALPLSFSLDPWSMNVVIIK